MNYSHLRSFLIAGIATVAVAVGGCGGTAPLLTSMPATQIEIDGNESDWYTTLRPVESQNMSIGVANDHEFLYVGMMTSDPALIHQFTSRGMVLWVDPAGGKEQAIGLGFPLGRTDAGTTPRSFDAREDLFDASLMEMELVRDAGDERVRIPANSIPGVSTRASLRNGTFFYEARLPLRLGGPYTFAAETAPGAIIGVGLESAELDPDVRRREMLEGAANSPMQGGGTYGGYYGGSTRNRMRADDTVRLWRRVVLVEEGL